MVVIANYYTNIADELLKSALNELKNIHQTKIINVPGVFEIPVTISKFIKKFDAAIALGCVIKGETPHFDFIAYASTNAIMQLAIDSKKPVGNGILTFVDINTKLNDFFNNDEVVFYKNINDLSKKINFYKENTNKRLKIAKNGKEKYFRIFNNKIVADYICSRLFQRNIKKELSWMK